MSTWQVTELPKSIDVHFDVVINAVDGEDAYKKLEKVEPNIYCHFQYLCDGTHRTNLPEPFYFE